MKIPIKGYSRGNTELEETCSKKPSNNLMAENCSNARKKRPPIQLYVPPAQRKSRHNESNSAQKNAQQNTQETEFPTSPKKDTAKKIYSHNRSMLENQEVKTDENPNICYCTEDVDCLYNNFPYFNSSCNFNKLIIFRDLFFLARLLIFNIKRMKHSYHWLNWKLHNGILTIYQNNVNPMAYCQKYILKVIIDSTHNSKILYMFKIITE